MSAYHTLKTQYKDRDCLVEALYEVGYTTVEVHEVAANLYGYHGDMRAQRANVIVRRKFVGAAANDLGFVKGEGGMYNAIVSEYDSGKHDTTWFNNLKKSYTEKVGMKTALKNGFKFLGKSIVNGKPQLKWLDARA